MIRVIGYGLSAIAAWVFYLIWISVEVPGSGSLSDRLLAALIFCLFGSFSAALMLMSFPWVVAVCFYRKARWSGAAYFGCVGALLNGCYGLRCFRTFAKATLH